MVLTLPMAARVVYPNPRIDSVRGCAAFERGPLVCCLEEADAGGPQHLESARVDTSAPVHYRNQLIAGEPVVALQVRSQPARRRG